jgi:RNase H-fold protein (predicted Holliday junction resolvase)
MKVLSFDPSGNYTEGKGTTGYAISLGDNLPHKLGDIKATDFNSKWSYWNEHENLIRQVEPDVIVIESYRLFGHKAKEQTGSSLETPQLIGYLEMVAWKLHTPVAFQDPSTKQRHADDVLVTLGVIEKKGNKFYYKGELTNLHQRDALRHGLYYRRSLRMKGVK